MAAPNKTLASLDDRALGRLLDIHCALSPENLSCDGELHGAEVGRRLHKALAQLDAFQREHGLPDEAMSETNAYHELRRRGNPVI